jgi:hypothetical protein
MLSVLLFLWSESSGPADKKAAHFVFRPELRMPHRLIAITDYPRDLFPSDIEYLPLVERFGELRRLGGCWLRLKCFAPGMEELIGHRCAWIDLDSIVCGTLDPLFDRPEPMVLFRSGSIPGQNWNGSVILFSPAENRDIWTEFDPDTSPAFVRELRGGLKNGPRGTDQAWLHHMRGPDTPHWSATDGILHWGRHASRTLPEHARILTFPGLEKPDSDKVRRRSPWIKAYWPMAGDFADGELPDIVPWPVTPSVEPPRLGRFKSLLKQRQEARDARRRMLDVRTVG